MCFSMKMPFNSLRNIRTVAVLLTSCAAVSVFARENILLEKGWKFTRADSVVFSQPEFDNSDWEEVRIPHDWAIYGPFDVNNDLQNIAIIQDGQTQAIEHTGRTGGLPFVGTGWYRLDFEIPKYNSEKNVEIIFDGAMSDARIWINGQFVGTWPYGYNSFSFDISKFVHEGINTVAVRCQNLSDSSRWYPGAGLYRNVHLVVTDKAHVPAWGTRIITPVITEEYAKVNINTEFIPAAGKKLSDYRINTIIVDNNGNRVGSVLSTPEEFDEVFNQTVIVKGPKLWSPESPQLYKAQSTIYDGNEKVDTFTTTFGIRSIELKPDDGFYLNGKKTKFKGVCMHHDLGPLGAAVNEAAIRRQIRILKEMGCNAIRTSHNMPAPELVKVCDEEGVMLVVESFDEWKYPKVKNGYSRLFDEWAEKDLTALIRHYRNSPAVVMWCIGNEVTEEWYYDGAGAKTARFLLDICHREDATRPVTQGNCAHDYVCANNMAAVLDVAGFNYSPQKYAEDYNRLPQRLILGTETASTLSSRGVYKFPLERKWMAKYHDHQASSYDVESCDWSNLPEDDFIQHDDLPYCIGEFVWTGFDYLGEPTPYYTHWPSHSSLFGIVDLAGLPKDRYWLYRSHWTPEKETLHILPHWTWPGREGEITPVMVYTNYPSAELFLNGRSLGKKSKNREVTIENSSDSTSIMNLKRLERYRLIWPDVKYQPGELRVVAYDENGTPIAVDSVMTAGKPYKIVLEPDREELDSSGRDLSFITVKIVDKDGNLCPHANNRVSFKVSGAGSFHAIANGDPSCIESFQSSSMSTFGGMLTAIIAGGEAPGAIRVEASSPNLKKASLNISVK